MDGVWRKCSIGLYIFDFFEENISRRNPKGVAHLQFFNYSDSGNFDVLSHLGKSEAELKKPLSKTQKVPSNKESHIPVAAIITV